MTGVTERAGRGTGEQIVAGGPMRRRRSGDTKGRGAGTGGPVRGGDEAWGGKGSYWGRRAAERNLGREGRESKAF